MANASAVYDYCVYHMGRGEIPWTDASTSLCCMLFGNTAPVKTSQHYSDETAKQLTGTNYIAGGKKMSLPTPSLSIVSANAQFMADATVWTNVTVNAYYASTYHTTTGSVGDPLGQMVSYHYLGGLQAVQTGTLTLNWNANGVFTCAITPEA